MERKKRSKGQRFAVSRAALDIDSSPEVKVQGPGFKRPLTWAPYIGSIPYASQIENDRFMLQPSLVDCSLGARDCLEGLEHVRDGICVQSINEFKDENDARLLSVSFPERPSTVDSEEIEFKDDSEYEKNLMDQKGLVSKNVPSKNNTNHVTQRSPGNHESGSRHWLNRAAFSTPVRVMSDYLNNYSDKEGSMLRDYEHLSLAPSNNATIDRCVEKFQYQPNRDGNSQRREQDFRPKLFHSRSQNTDTVPGTIRVNRLDRIDEVEPVSRASDADDGNTINQKEGSASHADNSEGNNLTDFVSTVSSAEAKLKTKHKSEAFHRDENYEDNEEDYESDFDQPAMPSCMQFEM